MPEVILREVKCTLTRDEKLERGQQLAQANAKKGQVEAEAKSAAADFKSQIKEIEIEGSQAALALLNGYEYRDLECTVTMHAPERGWKQFTRLDTGEVVGRERMAKEEFQGRLFEDEDGAGVTVARGGSA